MLTRIRISMNIIIPPRLEKKAEVLSGDREISVIELAELFKQAGFGDDNGNTYIEITK